MADEHARPEYEVFWDDLAADLKDPEFLQEYVRQSVRMSTGKPAPCPFCGLADGFHEWECSDKVALPAGKSLPLSSDQKRLMANICRNCGAPYDQPAIAPCRNPHHTAEQS